MLFWAYFNAKPFRDLEVINLLLVNLNLVFERKLVFLAGPLDFVADLSFCRKLPKFLKKRTRVSCKYDCGFFQNEFGNSITVAVSLN